MNYRHVHLTPTIRLSQSCFENIWYTKSSQGRTCDDSTAASAMKLELHDKAQGRVLPAEPTHSSNSRVRISHPLVPQCLLLLSNQMVRYKRPIPITQKSDGALFDSKKRSPRQTCPSTCLCPDVPMHTRYTNVTVTRTLSSSIASKHMSVCRVSHQGDAKVTLPLSVSLTQSSEVCLAGGRLTHNQAM